VRYLVIGGAGFVGSYIVDYLLGLKNTKNVIVFDNFSSGKKWHLISHLNNKKLTIYENDIYEFDILNKVMKNIDIVFHLAANPDISLAIIDPEIDFRQGTILTQKILESMRLSNCNHLIYASGSGVYGDVGEIFVSEKYSPLEPISTYGASKLSCESLICSYSHMFGIRASAFRFANVVGGRQTHGVCFDFIRRLLKDPSELLILGDGLQSKPYIHISDVIAAINIVINKQVKIFDVYNVAPNDYATVNDIAKLVFSNLGIFESNCKIKYKGGNRGWKGDVPIVRLDCNKLRSLGWCESLSSIEALNASISEMINNITYE